MLYKIPISYSVLRLCILELLLCCLVRSIPTNTNTSTSTNAEYKANDDGLAADFGGHSIGTRSFSMCPGIFQHVFENAMPRDEMQAGKIEVFPRSDVDINDEAYFRACLNSCCEKGQNNTCNVIFVFKDKCFQVHCISNEACLPKTRARTSNKLEMVLVNPVRTSDSHTDESVSWLDILKNSKENSELYQIAQLLKNNPNTLNFWKQPRRMRILNKNEDMGNYVDEDFGINPKQLGIGNVDESEDISSDILPFYASSLQPESSSNHPYKYCQLDLAQVTISCHANEQCMPNPKNQLTGICVCIPGYARNEDNECQPENMGYEKILSSAASENIPYTTNNAEVPEYQTEKIKPIETKKSIVVSVVSKEVRLPEKEATLAAFTVPDEQSSDTPYKYLWTLVTQPKGAMNGTISDQGKSKVKLSNLSEGLYTFKVSVTDGNGTYGEAMANVTVLPVKRINRVPQVVIIPKEQTIRQPTTNAVLDGSPSSDDDKIVSWHWEVTSGPIGYQPKLPDVSTLQLTDLTSPGNYSFKLTVTDSDNMSNFTLANITVLKETDYPPVANAGDGVVLYLPNNNITLNGTASSDDHEIVAWEWTKDASDETKAVDMQNTRTPFVQLSNLEEGMYTFVLKVTDGSGQSSSAKVHVFVKPPTNTPPKAVAGVNVTINLPQNWALLNGSASYDDIGIKSYRWTQSVGPNTAALLKANNSIANATALTLGLYQFTLNVTDENNNTSTDNVWIKVVQEKNAPPVANAGGDRSVSLPISALYLNGSASFDDLAVMKYRWTRDDNSLAAGVIVGNSDNEPVLIITNLVHGRYVFKLTVSDEQGLTSSDTVSVIVHPDPMLMHLIQLTVPMSITSLTHGELTKILQKIGLLLGDMKVSVRELKYDIQTEGSILIFYVESTDQNKQSVLIDALTVERILKQKLQQDVSILGAVYVDVRTVVCQNKCSDHGVCDANTRACICEAFWMPSVTYFWGWDEANCDWSILYVFVGIIVCFLLCSGIFWAIACACRKTKKPRTRAKLQRYSLIGTQDEETPHFSRTTSLTDSDTDSDVLFETRKKSNGILNGNSIAKSRSNHGPKKFMHPKSGRKIKT